MIRLALHGGLFSGKSTLALALEEQGFGYVNYTQLLKKYTLVALNALGQQVTLEDLEGERKEFYRDYVIATGTVIGFDHGFGIDESAIPAITASGIQNVVFDNVRFPAQMDKLVPHGFRLVRIITPYEVRERRALAKGMGTERFREATTAITEQVLPAYPGEVALVVDGPMEEVIEELMGRVAEAVLAERRAVA